MLKYKLCRICMKQKRANTTFVKIFESTAIGDLVANILIDFANVNVDQNDELPHIICNLCLENLIKCREFQKLVVQNDTTLAKLAEKTPSEMEKIIAEPLIRIEKVKESEGSTIIVQLDMTEDSGTEYLEDNITCQFSSSEDEDDFPIEEEVPEDPVAESLEPRFMCCCCPLHFSEEHEMIQHLKTAHHTIRSKLNILPIDKDPDVMKQCEMCFKYFEGMEKLVEHQAQFTNCEQCVECGEFYQRKGKISCQCKPVVEPKPKPRDTNYEKVECEMCGNKVKDLKSHIKKQHSNKLLECKQCDYATYQRGKMIRHVTKTHIEKKFPCSIMGCGKLFVSSDCRELIRHMERHAGAKKWLCKFCSKAFSDCSDCRRHEWQHTGVSPYMCSKCNKMFLRKNHLVMHEGKCGN